MKVLQQMVHHPLTDKGIVQFKKDWESARQAAGDGATGHGAAGHGA
jgi:transaldolase